MICPNCGSPKVIVKSTMPNDFHTRRRKMCLDCKRSFVTSEIIVGIVKQRKRTVNQYKEAAK